MWYLADKEQITVYFDDGTIAVWHNSDKDFNRVKKLCEKSDAIALKVMDNTAKAVLEADNVEINSHGIKIDGIPVDTKVHDDFLNLIKLCKDNGICDNKINEIKPFLINVCKNPFINASEELYRFLQKGDFEITEDGCFLAYKKVLSNLGSIFDDGKTKHEIGKYTEVKIYDTDRNKVCSVGLHFCSRNYLPYYSSYNENTDKILVVKVNPIDVVSIPLEYDNLKGRCRKYMPVKILENEEFLDTMDTNTLKDTKVVRSESRIDETARLMNENNNNTEVVANLMDITVSTVERNMRKYHAMHKK